MPSRHPTADELRAQPSRTIRHSIASPRTAQAGRGPQTRHGGTGRKRLREAHDVPSGAFARAASARSSQRRLPTIRREERLVFAPAKTGKSTLIRSDRHRVGFNTFGPEDEVRPPRWTPARADGGRRYSEGRKRRRRRERLGETRSRQPLGVHEPGRRHPIRPRTSIGCSTGSWIGRVAGMRPRSRTARALTPPSPTTSGRCSRCWPWWCASRLGACKSPPRKEFLDPTGNPRKVPSAPDGPGGRAPGPSGDRRYGCFV